MNPSLKSASMLLEIQIIVTFYHKNQLNIHKRIIKYIILKNFTNNKNTKMLKNPRKWLLKMYSKFEIFPSRKATFLSRYVLLATVSLTTWVLCFYWNKPAAYCKISHEIKSLFKFNSSRETYKACILEDKTNVCSYTSNVEGISYYIFVY